MAMMNNKGESRSPWHKPLLWRMTSPGSPFSKTHVVEDARRLQSRFLHRAPNPRWARTASKTAQNTESKAFVMSSLSRRLGVPRRCRNLAVCWTRRTLSWIHRPRIKALWFGEIMESNLGARPLARILVIKLPKLWTRLMGGSLPSLPGLPFWG